MKNEPHSVCGGRSWGGKGQFCNATCFSPNYEPRDCVEISWASGDKRYRWKRAAERAGTAILQENPDLLVSVSGLEYSTDLRLALKDPIQLNASHLLYEAHEYAWSRYSRHSKQTFSGFIEGQDRVMSEGEAKSLCDALGVQCSGVTCTAGASKCLVRSGKLQVSSTRRDISYRQELTGKDSFLVYQQHLDRSWGDLLQQAKAPVFVSEFGFGQQLSPLGIDWLERWSRYVSDSGPLANTGGLDWAYWSLIGVQEGGTGRTAGATESFGVLNRCSTGLASLGHFSHVQRLMNK